MAIQLRETRARKCSSRALLLALLPILTFMGHWPSAVHIPGTDSYLSIPLAGTETHDEESGTHNHSQHCHAGSAGCSDAPAAAGVTVAFGASGFVIAVADGLLLLALALSWRPASIRSLLPHTRPPKTWEPA